MLYAIVTVIILILDQGMKYWTTLNLELNTGVKELIPGVIHLTNIHNTGAAFGFLKNGRWLFIIVTVMFVVLVVVALAKKIIRGEFGRWMAVAVMAGALGNGIDRIIQGYVVDMFEIEFFNFYVFNVADIFITCGCILFCIYLIFYKDKSGAPVANIKKMAEEERRERMQDDELVGRRFGDIESISKDYSAKKPAHRTPAKPEPKPIDPDDPFAEWENLMKEPEEKAAEPETVQEEKPVSPAAEAEEPKPETAPESKAAPEPAAVPAEETDEDMEFSLEDILAEFRDN